jgi:hypothetical protein
MEARSSEGADLTLGKVGTFIQSQFPDPRVGIGGSVGYRCYQTLHAKGQHIENYAGRKGGKVDLSRGLGIPRSTREVALCR